MNQKAQQKAQMRAAEGYSQALRPNQRAAGRISVSVSDSLWLLILATSAFLNRNFYRDYAMLFDESLSDRICVHFYKLT